MPAPEKCDVDDADGDRDIDSFDDGAHDDPDTCGLLGILTPPSKEYGIHMRRSGGRAH